MGDFLSPKQTVVDRYRRRFDIYRRHQNSIQQRYEYGQKHIYEQEKQHARLLCQKWYESKAKKSSKNKNKSDSSHPDHRNQTVTKRLKHKLDGNTVDSTANTQQQQQHQNHPENIYRFEDDDAPPAKKITSNTSIDGLSSSVSINIVHNINGGNNQQEPKISTNVTVNQTINPQKQASTKDSENNQSQSNVECKKEPNEDPANTSNTSDIDSSDIDYILNTFDDIPQEIVDELNKFDEICKGVLDSETSGSGNEGNLNQSSDSGTGNMFASGMYSDPGHGPGQVRTPPMQQHYRPNQAHAPSTMSEGGLAAETLKQMAAQHQQHHPSQEQYGAKSAVDPFSDMSETGQFGSRNADYSNPEFYSGMPRSGSSGPFSGQNNNMGYSKQQQQSNMPQYGAAATNNNNKLTHYAHNTPTSQGQGQSETGPSSLQQLQNQVAHFNQPQMEITQTQHMQVSDGSQRLQMSQTQHVQLRQPIQNISLTQHQGFSTSPNMGPSPTNMGPSPNGMGPSPNGMAPSQNGMGPSPNGMGPSSSGMGPNQSQNFMNSEQMTLQQQQIMHNKMRQERQAQMQYMNRPPPEYKMQHANGMTPGMSSNSMGPNPLQTMQNMVNQTNTHQNPAYSSVKSESSDIQTAQMRSAQMTAMQQQQLGAQVNPMGMPMSQAQLNYSNQAVQRQASFPGALAHPMSRPQRPNAPTYTSAIMRNQRPPNVNIGPDGLNISQPRHPQEWPRGINPMQQAQAIRGGAPVSSAAMMQHYRSYSTDGHTSSAAAAAAQMQMHQQHGQGSVHMEAMQSQAMMQQQGNARAQQMMMQQQRMHMSQQHMGQGSHSAQSPPYGMSSQQGNGYPQASSQDDILNLLDTAPNQSTDFFDVQTSNTEANWYDIDDILGNPK